MRYTAFITLAALLAAAGCDLFDNALQVETPSSIPASALETPANAQLLVNGAIGDFECAAGAYAVMSGLITDELVDATQTADRYPYELRTMVSSDRRYAVNSCVGLGVYTPLQTARFSAENVLSLLKSWTDAQVPNRTDLIAKAAAYDGYSLVMLGEGFCSMVISTLDANRRIVYGGEIQPDSVFTLAVAAFSEAIAAAQAAGDNDILNIALVGRARAYIDLNQPALAQADAQLVDSPYVKVVTASGINLRRNNRVWQENSATSDNTSIGAPYVAMWQAGDSVRIPLKDKNKSSVTGIHLWEQLKYQSSSAPIRLASWDEAQLIIAEADLKASDFTDADSIINIFRARGGQSAITSTNTDTVTAALFDQRSREFFLEGQHLGDVIRFNVMPDPPPGTVYAGGGTYGTQRCLPLPDVEKQNNPNF